MKSVLILLLLSSLQLSGQDKPADGKKNPSTVTGAPIPEKILLAKTVSILITADKKEYYYKTAYRFLADWDRWKILAEPKDADLVIKITNRDDGSIGMGTGSVVGGPGYAAASSVAVGVKLHHFYLFVLDPQSGETLWSTDTDQRLVNSANATRMLKQLRERIAEADKIKKRL